MKNNEIVNVKFLQIDSRTNLPSWSSKVAISIDSLNNLSLSQIKRIVNLENNKIIFLKENSNLGIIAICVYDI